MIYWRWSVPCLVQTGQLPLHYALEIKTGLDIVELLLLACPAAASMADGVRCRGICSTHAHTQNTLSCMYIGMNTYTRYACVYLYIIYEHPLHTCIHSHMGFLYNFKKIHTWVLLTYIYEYLIVHTWDFFYCVTTHIHMSPRACMGAAVHMPSCCLSVSGWRRSLPPFAQHRHLPLHYALQNKAEPEVVEALLQAYPAAASTPDAVCFGTLVACAWSVHSCMLHKWLYAFGSKIHMYG